jgi:hypothetical protein
MGYEKRKDMGQKPDVMVKAKGEEKKMTPAKKAAAKKMVAKKTMTKKKM